MRSKKLLAVAALGLASSTAYAFYWDIDMVDAYFVRAYEAPMLQLPEESVSQNRWVANYDRLTPEGQALASPYPADEAHLAQGEKMFNTYCSTCHGKEGKGGAAVMKNGPGANRYPVPPAMLSGAGNSSALRTDGYIYLTIRNGGNIMKGYDISMNEEEMWSVVSYIRTLEGAQYTPPKPAEGEGTGE